MLAKRSRTVVSPDGNLVEEEEDADGPADEDEDPAIADGTELVALTCVDPLARAASCLMSLLLL